MILLSYLSYSTILHHILSYSCHTLSYSVISVILCHICHTLSYSVISVILCHTLSYSCLHCCEPKSCAHEYNYVVLLPIQPVKKVYHIIIFMCTAFWFTFCNINANSCTCHTLSYSIILCHTLSYSVILCHTLSYLT